ncbi:hypothetical protein JCM11641_005676 [Rhodosporidiobolus odoratus]
MSDPTDTAYRAHLRSIAIHLVPPSSPIISSLLLSANSATTPQLSVEWTTGHAEHNIDFWDARKMPEWKDEKWEKLEMKREQVEELRKERGKWIERGRQAEAEDSKLSTGPWPTSFRLKDDFLLPRHSRSIGRNTTTAIDLRGQLASLTGRPPKRLLPKPDERMLAMDAMPNIDEALDLKLAIPPADLEFLKTTRAEHRNRSKLSALGSITQSEEDALAPLHAFPFAEARPTFLALVPSFFLAKLRFYPQSPRLGSPPLFARRSSAAHPVQSGSLNPLGSLVLTSEISDLPSSPRGPGIRQEEWNKEEGIMPPPISPSTVRQAVTNKPLTVWSSDGFEPLVKDGESYGLEKPIFPRRVQPTPGPALNFPSVLLAAADEDEVDQLDSDTDEEDRAVSQELTKRMCTDGGSLGELFASDDTIGDQVAKESSLVTSLRLKVPSLQYPLGRLATPTMPPLSAFTPSSSSPFSLSPLPGLRSLSISLSWDFTPRPEAHGGIESLVDLVAGEEDAEDALRKKARQVRADYLNEMREDDDEVGELSPRGKWPADGSDADTDDEVVLARASVVEVDMAEPAKTAEFDSIPDNTELPQLVGAVEPEGGSTLLPVQSEQAVTLPLAGTEPVDQDAAVGVTTPRPTPSSVKETLTSPVRHDSSAFLPRTATARLSQLPSSARSPPPAPNEPLFTSSSSDLGFIFPINSPSPSQSVPAEEVEPIDIEHINTLGIPPIPETFPSAPTAGYSAPTESGFLASGLDDLVANVASRRSSQVEKAKPSADSSTSTALDRFLAARGRTIAPKPLVTIFQPKPDSPLEAPPSPHSSPPPGSIPFTVPPFLHDRAGSPALRLEALRVVAFDSLFQLRPHLVALSQQNILPIHRPSRFPPQPHVTQEPHLILSPSICVLFVPLPSLIGNARRLDEEATLADNSSPSMPRTRSEALYTTVLRLSARFSTILLVLEERQARVGGVKTYSWTPPVLAGLQQLADGLAELASDGEVGVQVALSKGAEHSAELVRSLAEWLEREERKKGGMPAVDIWGDRQWLRDDPSDDESALLQLADLNELSASLILASSSLNEFLGLSSSDRLAIFGSIIGKEQIVTLFSRLIPPLLSAHTFAPSVSRRQNRISTVISRRKSDFADSLYGCSSSSGNDVTPSFAHPQGRVGGRLSEIAAAEAEGSSEGIGFEEAFDYVRYAGMEE